MQEKTGPPQFGPYTPGVARKPNPSKGQRPPQGTRLLTLRKAAGLTQTELADFLDVPQGNIAFWEWSEKPPRSDLLPKMAKALRVDVADLIAAAASAPLAKKAGPVGEVQRVFEEVRKLPRSQQRKIIETVDALVTQYRRKAS